MAQQIKITQTSNADMNIGVPKNLTAVEWLQKQIKLSAFVDRTQGFTYLDTEILFEMLAKAKQMEKEQIMNARLDGFKESGEGWNGEYPGWDDKETSIQINNEQYYNETYKLISCDNQNP